MPHLVPALQAITKSKEGLSNPELDEVIADNSEWMTLWVVRQLTSLGFIEYKVDLFGEPARYQATELGRSAMTAISEQPALKAPAPPSPPVQAPVAKA